MKIMLYLCKRNGGERIGSPYFIEIFVMVDKKFTEDIVSTFLEGKKIFLVGVKITKSNVITVTIDGDEGVVVEDCIAVSKYIESKLDRDKEDFELTVTSFGLEEYFKMPRQYVKNIGQNVEVVLKDGTKLNGILSSVEDGKVTLTNKKQKAPLVMDFDQIDKTRVLLNI